jgi:hypothetical protein
MLLGVRGSSISIALAAPLGGCIRRDRAGGRFHRLFGGRALSRTINCCRTRQPIGGCGWFARDESHPRDGEHVLYREQAS